MVAWLVFSGVASLVVESVALMDVQMVVSMVS
jgi:hypothetical protein